MSMFLVMATVVSLQMSCLALVYVEGPRRSGQAVHAKPDSKASSLLQAFQEMDHRHSSRWQWPWMWSGQVPPMEMEVDHYSRAFPNPIHKTVSRPLRSDLTAQLYKGQEPFDLFTNSRALSFRGDLGWSNIGAHPEDVKFLIDLAGASFIVEVGSYVGTSTKRWTEGLRQKGVPVDQRAVLCIDTWLGDLASWVTRVDSHSRAGFDDVLVDGRSRLYDQFMLNMIGHNMTDTVVPFSVTSTVGARWLAYQNYQADLIYVDAAHEQGESELELELYWKQVKPGGVMAGDDYPGWAAVKHDVDDFVKRYGLTVKFAPSGLTWYVVKPEAQVLQAK